MVGLTNLFQHSMDIRPGEGGRVALMFTYIFLVITALMIVKPVANSLFLSSFGAGRLPAAFIAVALLAVPVFSLYSRWLHRIDFFRLIDRTLQLDIAALVLFRAAMLSDVVAAPTVFVLYVWVAVTGLIVVSQFWILANAIFNPREAKRLISVVGAGAIAGGILGGYLANLLAGWLGSANLILVGAGCLAVCIVLNTRLHRNTRDDAHLQRIRHREQAATEPRHPLLTVTRSRHLRFLSGIIGLSVIAAKLVEYQFSAVATAEIPDPDRLTAFFGFWLSTLNLISLLIQLFVTRRVVGTIGVGVSLFFLPLAIAIGSVLILVQPVLWAAICLKVGDGSLKNAINKAALELIVLPVPVEIKNQAKTFIDVIVDSAATGLGGLLLLGLTAVYGLSVRPAAILTLLLVGGWVVLIQRLRKEYIEAFRLSLALPTKPEPSAAPAAPSIVDGLIEALGSDPAERVLQALRMARTIHQPRLVPSLLRLVEHPSPRIRLEALKGLYPYRDAAVAAALRDLIATRADQIDQAALTEAMHYLFRHGGKNRIAMLRDYMAQDHPAVSAAALVCAALESRRNHRLREALRVPATIDGLLQQIPSTGGGAAGARLKQICAAVIGAANMPSRFPYLNVFLDDADLDVVRAAVVAAGQTRDDAFVPAILRKMRHPPLQPVCSEALTRFGPDIERLLADCLANPLVAHDIRRHMPAALAEIGSASAAAVLLESLRHRDASVRSECIQALQQLRWQKRDLRFDDRAVERGIVLEIGRYRNTLATLYHQIRTEVPDRAGEGVRAVRKRLAGEIEKRLDVNLAHIFSLLGLRYPVQDISRAYQGLVSDQPDLRANAVEFLDNLLDADLKQTLIPIVETFLVDSMIEQTLQRLELRVPTEIDAFTQMLPEADADLQLLSLDLIERLADSAYVGLVAELVANPHAGVRDAAGRLLKKMGYG